MPVGGRVLIRSRVDWRVAVISRKNDDGITLSVASPKGRNYRIKRSPGTELTLDGAIPFLDSEYPEPWRDNFTQYDGRW